MTHVREDLELYAVGALPASESAAVAAHLAECPACRSAAEDIAEIVTLLPDAVPLREPPARLRTRILEAARAERAPARRPWLTRILPGLALAGVALAVVALVGVDANQALALRTVAAERAEYERIALDFAHGGRSWYMAGVAEWKGMGGNLVQPASGDPAFVLFHGLRELPDGQRYTVWLISPDGRWVRGANFRADGRALQRVSVGLDLVGSDRCAVTVEAATDGRREGPVVMQSRISPPPTQ